MWGFICTPLNNGNIHDNWHATKQALPFSRLRNNSIWTNNTSLNWSGVDHSFITDPIQDVTSVFSGFLRASQLHVFITWRTTKLCFVLQVHVHQPQMLCYLRAILFPLSRGASHWKAFLLPPFDLVFVQMTFNHLACFPVLDILHVVSLNHSGLQYVPAWTDGLLLGTEHLCTDW